MVSWSGCTVLSLVRYYWEIRDPVALTRLGIDSYTTRLIPIPQRKSSLEFTPCSAKLVSVTGSLISQFLRYVDLAQPDE